MCMNPAIEMTREWKVRNVAVLAARLISEGRLRAYTSRTGSDDLIIVENGGREYRLFFSEGSAVRIEMRACSAVPFIPSYAVWQAFTPAVPWAAAALNLLFSEVRDAPRRIYAD